MDTPEISQIPVVTPPLTTEQVTKKSGITSPKWLVFLLAGLLLLIIFGGAVYTYFQYNKSIATKLVVVKPTPTVVTPIMGSETPGIYQDKYIRFSYDPSWKIIDLKSLVKTKYATYSAAAPFPILFISPSKWPTVEKIIKEYQIQDKPLVSTRMMDVAPQGILSQADASYGGRNFVDDSFEEGGEMNALNMAKTIAVFMCIPPGWRLGTSHPTPRIEEIVVNKRKAAALLPDSTCPDSKGIAIVFIDGKITNETYSFIFRLEGNDIKNLSPEQKIIFNSIEIL